MEKEIEDITQTEWKTFMETELPSTVLSICQSSTLCDICLTREDRIYRVEMDSDKKIGGHSLKERGLRSVLFLCPKCENKLSKLIYSQPNTGEGVNVVVNYFKDLSFAVHTGDRKEYISFVEE